MRHPYTPHRETQRNRNPTAPVTLDQTSTSRARLALRLHEGTATAAKALAFRVPGQSRSHGHTDYQPRLLTDAVMTSLALKSIELGWGPVDDDVLHDIHPVIRHQAAGGLWKLAVLATRTESEKAALNEGDMSQQQREQRQARERISYDRNEAELIAAILRGDEAGLHDEETFWHSMVRFDTVRNLAARHLSTTGRNDPERWEQALYSQNGKDWDTLTDWAYSEKQTVGRGNRVNLEHRGGAAVWRARRSLALENIARWLTESGSSTTERSIHPQPPGWHLALSDGWLPLAFPPGAPLPPTWKKHISQNHALHFEVGRSHVVWPTIYADNNDGAAPVPGIDHALTALMNATADPRKAAEVLLLKLLPRDGDDARRQTVSPVPGLALLPTGAPFQPSSTPLAVQPWLTYDEQLPELHDDVPPLPDIRQWLANSAPGSTVQDEQEDDDTNYGVFEVANQQSYFTVLVPAETAHRLGFVSAADAARRIREARAENQRRMQFALMRNSRNRARHQALKAALSKPEEFARLTRRYKDPYRESRAVWCWRVTCLVEQIGVCSDPQLTWLIDHLLTDVLRRELSRSMREAGDVAVHRYAHLYRRTTSKVHHPP